MASTFGTERTFYFSDAESLPYGTYTVKTYVVLTTNFGDDGTVLGVGRPYTTSITLAPLWKTRPVISKAGVTDTTLNVTYTYYGCPDQLNIQVTAPDGTVADVNPDAYWDEETGTVESYVTDAGSAGIKRTTKLNLPTLFGKMAYGSYSVKVQSVCDSTVSSKAVKVKAEVNAFIASKLAVKSVAQTTETSVTVTLKKAATQLKTGMTDYYLRAVVDGDEDTAQYFKPGATSLKLTGLTSGSHTVEIRPVFYDAEMDGYLRGLYPVTKTFTVTEGFWNQIAPVFTLTQVADSRIQLTATKGNADAYCYRVTDSQGVVYEEEDFLFSRGETVEIPVNSIGTATVEVWAVNGDEKGLSATKTITLVSQWDKISKVTVTKANKKDSVVNVSFTYKVLPDAVSVQAFYTFGKYVSSEAWQTWQVAASEMTVNTSKKTASFSLTTDMFDGTYIFKVTPLVYSRDANGYDGEMIVGTTVNAGKTVTFTSASWRNKQAYGALDGDPDTGSLWV